MKTIIILLGLVFAVPSWGSDSVSSDTELHRAKRAANILIPAIMADYETMALYITEHKTDGEEWFNGALDFAHHLRTNTMKIIEPYLADFHSSVILVTEKINGSGDKVKVFTIGERFDNFKPTKVLTPAGDVTGLEGKWYILDPEFYRDTQIVPYLQPADSVLQESEIHHYMNKFRSMYDDIHSIVNF